MAKPDPADYGRFRQVLKGQRLPLAFMDLESFERNADYVAATQKDSGKKVRLHTKSLRCPDLTRLLLDRHTGVFQGLMTFSVKETAWLAGLGFDDFIIAYPSVQPMDLKLMADMAHQGITVSLMVDSIRQLELLDEIGRERGVVIKTCLDLDVSYRPLGDRVHLGPRRSPIRTPAQAVEVARASRDMTGVEIDSLMGYEAQVASPLDDLPGKTFGNRITRLIKRLSMKELIGRRGEVIAELKALGLNLRAVNGGGSGSLIASAKDPVLTEVTAGSAFYAPALFWHYREVDFTPAAYFAIQVVRRPVNDIITCQGGGYAASGGAGPDKLPRPVLPPDMELLAMEGAGEVQTPIRVPPDCPDLELGDPVIFQHAKAGELAERFNFFHLVRGAEITGRAETYRGRGHAFI